MSQSFYLFVLVWLLPGIFLCFFGHRFFRKILVALGFAFGTGIGCLLASKVFSPPTTLQTVLTAVVVGIVCGALALMSYYVAIFLLGFQVGALLGLWVTPLIAPLVNCSTDVVMVIVVIVIGTIMGFLALSAETMIRIAITAFDGASLMAFGVIVAVLGVYFSPEVVMEDPERFVGMRAVQLAFGAGSLILGILGCIYQLRSIRRRRQEPL